MTFYRRKLPHWQPKGAQYFITLRLAGSLPSKVIKGLKIFREQFHNLHKRDDFDSQILYQRKIFRMHESALDFGYTGQVWLKNPAVAEVVQEAMHYRDAKEYDLFAYSVMSNHVHIVFEHLDKNLNEIDSNSFSNVYPITEILRELKRFTAQESNKILNRKGAFWQAESYDRVIRDEKELENTIAYTLNNPVKAGLVKHWKDWPYTYCKPEFLKSFA